MTNPSTFFEETADLCGWPGRAFVRAHQRWRRPTGVPYPTIRRHDWGAAAAESRGDVPSIFPGAEAGFTRSCADAFVWAHAAWRGFFGPQLDGYLSQRFDGFDGRECHPFALGYVRGAVEQLVTTAGFVDQRRLSGFIRIGTLADLFGLEWVDDLDDAISDLASGRLGARSTGEFHHGAELGWSDMERYLDGTAPEPRQLLDWLVSSTRSDGAPARHDSRFDPHTNETAAGEQQ